MDMDAGDHQSSFMHIPTLLDDGESTFYDLQDFIDNMPDEAHLLGCEFGKLNLDLDI